MKKASGPEVDIDLVAADLVKQYLQRVRVFAARRLGDLTAAEDAAQETVRRVLEALRQRRVRDLQALPSYTFETARHVCQHVLRERQGMRIATTDIRDVEVAVQRPDPLAALVSAERADQVRRAVLGLEPIDREIVRLSFVEGYGSAEIAERVGLSAVNVRVRRHRALRRLGSVLSVTAGRSSEPLE